MAERKMWKVPVIGQDPAYRLVKATTAQRAWKHVAETVVGEAERATTDDAVSLTLAGVKVEEAKED